jgi:pimeloyl-ACP methyl ester carboxylesterase
LEALLIEGGPERAPQAAISPLPGDAIRVRGVRRSLQTPIGRSTVSEQTTKALPIVLIHGLWMTARSWDRWAQHYRAKGHEVIVPSYPGFEIEVEALRESPRSSPRHPPPQPSTTSAR